MFSIRTASALALSLGLVAANTSAWAQEAMGSVAGIAGSPSATGANGSRALSVGGTVFEGDRINVGPGGNAQIVLTDGTKLVVGPSSQLVLQSYLLRNASTAKKVSVKALRGTFRFITGNSPKSSYDISTTNATIGIRGTGFDASVAGSTIVAVHAGAVRVRGSNGQSVTGNEGCEVVEGGPNSVVAQELEGEQASNALVNLPYIEDQSPLGEDFQLDTTPCLSLLPNNGGGLAPTVPALIVPLVAIPPLVYVLTQDDENDPVSEDGGPISDGICEYSSTGAGVNPNDPDCIIDVGNGA